MAGLLVILVDAAAVDLLWVDRPRLLFSLLPTLAVILRTFLPVVGYAAGAVALVLGPWLAPCAVAATPAATAGILEWGRRHRRWMPIAAVATLALVAFQVHSGGARQQNELMQRLDFALAARDRGDLTAAKQELAALAVDFPGSHVPLALLGEIDYRTERLEEARAAFARAVEVKQDYVKGFRYLAVIDLRLGRKEGAARSAGRGLEIDGADPELHYLLARAQESQDLGSHLALGNPEIAQTLAALAFEVGDIAGAAAMLDRGIALWPEQRSFYPSRVNLALQSGDVVGARRFVVAWRDRFPRDVEARQLSRQLGMH
jgi:tetratricopeptide (TPR) repeat protein